MFFILISAAIASEPSNVQTLQTIEKNTKDINCKLKGIELFLSDKENYSTHCSSIKWEQPELSVYVDKGVSQLPSECVSLVTAVPTEEQTK